MASHGVSRRSAPPSGKRNAALSPDPLYCETCQVPVTPQLRTDGLIVNDHLLVWAACPLCQHPLGRAEPPRGHLQLSPPSTAPS